MGSVGATAAPAAGVGAAQDSKPKTLMDMFASILAKAGGELAATAGVEITHESTATLNGIDLHGELGGLLGALLGGGRPVTTQTAVPVEGEAATVPGESLGLADLLLKIEAALDVGETIDPELLKTLKASIDALAAAIGGPVDASTVVPASFNLSIEVAAATSIEPLAVNPETEPQVPELKVLVDRLKELAGKVGSIDADVAVRLEALAEKLGALKTTVAQLIEAAPELKAVIEALTKTKIETVSTVTVAAPALAAPQLKLPADTSISAKQAERELAASSADKVDLPADSETTAAKLEAKADVKVDRPAVASAPEKRDVSAMMPITHAATASADTTVAASATAAGAGANVHGEVRAVHTAYQLPAPINLPHMAFEIAKHVQQGVSKFQIRLDPPELGRIDVKLDIDQSGQVNAKLIVERSETLDLLQRDQRALERALAQAGLDANKTNLEFSLKQNPFAGQDGKGGHQTGLPFGDTRAPVIAEAEPGIATTVYRGTASAAGVNIFV